jgi:hypothetical protein
MISGVLHRMLSGRWAVCRSGACPIDIQSGDMFWLEVGGKMKKTRMEFERYARPGRAWGGLKGEFYSVDGYCLRDGLRAAIG